MEKINYLNEVMFLLLGSITMSIILSQISLSIAPLFGLIDIPGSENHKSHSKSIPITGGIVLIMTVTTIAVFGNLWGDGPISNILICVLRARPGPPDAMGPTAPTSLGKPRLNEAGPRRLA